MTIYEMQFIRAIVNDLMMVIKTIDPDWEGYCPSGGSEKDYYRKHCADTSLAHVDSPGVILLHATSRHPVGRKLEEMALALYQLSAGMEVLSPPRQAYPLEEYVEACGDLLGKMTLAAPTQQTVEVAGTPAPTPTPGSFVRCCTPGCKQPLWTWLPPRLHSRLMCCACSCRYPDEVVSVANETTRTEAGDETV